MGGVAVRHIGFARLRELAIGEEKLYFKKPI